MLPSPKNIKSAVMLGGLLLGGYLFYKAKKQAEVLATETLNPASDKNIVYENTPAPIKAGLNNFWGKLDKWGVLPK